MPRRWVVRLCFLFAATFLAVNTPVRGQAGGAKDTVTYFDRKENKVVSVDTEVKKESPAGVEFLIGKDLKPIAAPDIIRIDYGVPGITKSDIISIRQLEDTGDFGKAQARYAALQKTAGSNPKAKRYLAFREAILGAEIADTKTKDEEFKAEAEKAIKSLADFAQQNDKSWEVWPASRTAARLQMELGQFDAAAGTLTKLGGIVDLGTDLRYEAKLAAAAAALRGGNPTGAKLVADLEKDGAFPKTGPLRQRLAVLSVAAKFPKAGDGSNTKPAVAATMEKAIADATDPAARAVGYNFLGDLYRSHGLGRDAMWAYLWVDTVYTQDKDERVYAVRKLVGVFEAAGDADRAGQFRDRLPSAR